MRYALRRIQDSPFRLPIIKISHHIAVRMWRRHYLRHRATIVWRNPQSIDVALSTLVTAGQRFAENLRRRYADDLDYSNRTRARAAMVLSGRFPVLGYGIIRIPEGSGWHEDAFHGSRWGMDYFADIDILQRNATSDVKVPWELSRLQFLVWLAERACLAAEEERTECVTRLEEILDDWIEANPVGFGVNWACPMEVAIRLANVLVACSIAGQFMKRKRLRRALELVDESRRFIARFPELSDIPGNHYLADLMGLAVAEVMLGEYPDISRSAVQRFAKEAAKQFELDGCHIERAPIYHRLCLDMLLLVASALRGGGHQLPNLLEEAIHRANAFCEFLVDQSDRLPVMEDSDSGHIIWVGQDHRDYQPTRAIVRSMFGGPGSATSDAEGSDYAALMACLGDASDADPGRQHVEGKEPRPPSAGVRSGFVVLRGGPWHVVLRAGQRGLNGHGGHDHDDQLSIWASYDGIDFIVERGCHSYSLSEKVRALDISASSHSRLTLQYEGRQNEAPARFLARSPRSPIAYVEVNPTSAESISAEGTIRLGARAKECTWTRFVEIKQTNHRWSLKVCDDWDSKMPVRPVVRWFLLTPQATQQSSGSPKVHVTNLGRNDTGEWREAQIARHYGRWESAPCLSIVARSECLAGRIETHFDEVDFAPRS